MDTLDNFMKVSWGYVAGDPNIRIMAEAKADSNTECVLGLGMLARAIYDDMAQDNDPERVRKAIFEGIKAIMDLDDADIQKEGVTIRMPPKKS